MKEEADLLSQHQAGILYDGITLKLRIENRTGETVVIEKDRCGNVCFDHLPL